MTDRRTCGFTHAWLRPELLNMNAARGEVVALSAPVTLSSLEVTRCDGQNASKCSKVVVESN